ncbi:hypothetical protein ABZX85_27700 [Streptomyces sp. NPDC004539]|uniref:hypothetical protein n=1 Tax=Streptomyces sp. NPDC004539 TaxID=3154280 RepID=UPI0033A0107F
MVAEDWRDPEWSLEAMRRFVERHKWKAGRVFMDDFLWSTCTARPGWGLVRMEIGSGLADGVVVLTKHVVSRNAGEYAEQLAWLRGRSAFIAVMQPGAWGEWS